MPKGKKLNNEELAAILDTSAELKAGRDDITSREIGEIVDRSHHSVLKVMSDKKFDAYKAKYKKKIDANRMLILDLADKQILEALIAKKLNPFQLIGLSKTFNEQVWPQNIPLIGGANAQIAVQVVRGGISYNTDKKEKGTTQAQSDDA
jgi:hypothetical protein